VVQGISFPVNDNFVELLFWIDAFKRASATQVTAVIPFFSYAKGDKKDEPRVSIRARVCADCVEGAGADRVLTMDMHSPQIQGFFQRPVDHLYAMPVICEYFRKKSIPNLAVASTDVGFGKQAAKYADLLGVPVVIGNKERPDHSEQARVWSVIGDVKDRNVLIVDDIVFSGGSLIAMAHAVKEKGAREVYAAVSHGVLSRGASQRIAASPIKELVITDTLEYRFDELPPNVRIGGNPVDS
jgi:ribose-phosphate pyrophosphokinase